MSWRAPHTITRNGEKEKSRRRVQMSEGIIPTPPGVSPDDIYAGSMGKTYSGHCYEADVRRNYPTRITYPVGSPLEARYPAGTTR